MKTYQTDQIKNIVLLGNSGSGKTILGESMLFNGALLNVEELLKVKIQLPIIVR